MKNKLFNEFSDVSSKEWKQKIQADLKGADYNETLIWKTNEGIDVKPFYHADEFSTLPSISSSQASQWLICDTIFVSDIKKSNHYAKEFLSRGAQSIKFIIPSKDVSIKTLLEGIDAYAASLYFELQFLDSEFVKTLSQFQSKAEIYIHTDIIGNLARTGNWFSSIQEDHKQLEIIAEETSTISVDLSLYQNAGATILKSFRK